jgi:ankyrin repeat protein
MGKGQPRQPKRDPKFDIFLAIAKGDLVWVKQLIDLDTDVNINSGKTPLHCAVEWQNPECASFLLDSGADINGRNSSGETPLRVAVETSHTLQIYAPEVARILIERGADVNAQGPWNSILHEALRSQKSDSDDKELIELLKASGANIWPT